MVGFSRVRSEEGPIQAAPREPVQAVPGTPTPPSEVFLTAADKSATTQLCTVHCVCSLAAISAPCCQSIAAQLCCLLAMPKQQFELVVQQSQLTAPKPRLNTISSQPLSCPNCQAFSHLFCRPSTFPKEQDLNKSNHASIHHCSGCYLPVKGMAATQNIGKMNRNIAA